MRLISLLALLLTLPCLAHAQNADAENHNAIAGTVTAGYLTYGTAATFPPFEFVKDGSLVGFDIDLAAEVASRMHLASSPVNMEFGGLIPALIGHRIDVINSAMYLSPEREGVVDFVPYLSISSVVLVPRDSRLPVTGYDLSLCGLRVGVTLGGIEMRDADKATENCLQNKKPALIILPYPTAQNTALNLLQERTDAAFTSQFGAAVLMQEVPGRYRVAGRPFGTEGQIGLAVAKTNPELRGSLTKAVQELKKDGRLDQLIKKWHLNRGQDVSDVEESGKASDWWVTVKLTLDYLVSPPFLKGAGITLFLTTSSLIVGSLIGIILAVISGGRFGFFRLSVMIYLWLFRGTPVLLQIVFIYNVLPLLGLKLAALTSAVLALSLNEGAYMAEIARSGLDAVKPEQKTAGLALGLSPLSVFRCITAPQAFRITLPMLGNQVIGLLKSSALVSVIAVPELLLAADQAASANFRYIEALSAAAIYYLAFTSLFMLLQRYLEQSLAPGKSSSEKALHRAQAAMESVR